MIKKNCLKILVMLGLALLTVCILNTNVNAADETLTDEDKQYVETALNKIPKNSEGTYEIVTYYGLVDEEYIEDVVIDTLNEIVNDDSIKFVQEGGSGGYDTPLATYNTEPSYKVYKDNIYYKSININHKDIFGVNVPENEEDIIKYLTSKINDYLDVIFEIEGTKNTLSGEVIKIDKVSDNNYSVKYNTYIKKYSSDTEFTKEDEQEEQDTITVIIKKAEKVEQTIKSVTSTDKTTNIKLDTTSDIVPTGTVILTEKITSGTSYNTVKTTLGSNVSKFELYNISLINNNATVQPNGKVKVSIPVPNGFDTSKIVVYYVADNGDKTKYDTTINEGYITFETDHFSNYVVAEEATATETNETSKTTNTTSDNTSTVTTTTNTTNKLDDTPKTGEETNVTSVVAAIISILSAVGLAIIKRF